MLYREAGQFKSPTPQDQQIFPIRQDRIAVIAAARRRLRRRAADRATSTGCRRILIPFLIFSLAALGLNILTGYAGQLSLGTAAFMAVGAFAAYNFELRVPALPLLVSFCPRRAAAPRSVGIVFGLPSLRIKGFYLAVATLAAPVLRRLGAGAHSAGSPTTRSSGVITAQTIAIFGSHSTRRSRSTCSR